MSFDEVLFPLPAKYGTKVTAAFLTDVVTLASGYERRNQAWAKPRRCYRLLSGVLSNAEADILQGFFVARAGRARGFRLRDWQDHTCKPGQVIGVGDGVTVAFPLKKSYGVLGSIYERVITKPVLGTVTVAVDGIAWESEWSVDGGSGVVTFAQAPSVGVVITAGCEFDVPVRFDTDSLEVSAADKGLRFADIPMIEVRV